MSSIDRDEDVRILNYMYTSTREENWLYLFFSLLEDWKIFLCQDRGDSLLINEDKDQCWRSYHSLTPFFLIFTVSSLEIWRNLTPLIQPFIFYWLMLRFLRSRCLLQHFNLQAWVMTDTWMESPPLEHKSKFKNLWLIQGSSSFKTNNKTEPKEFWHTPSLWPIKKTKESGSKLRDVRGSGIRDWPSGGFFIDVKAPGFVWANPASQVCWFGLHVFGTSSALNLPKISCFSREFLCKIL